MSKKNRKINYQVKTTSNVSEDATVETSATINENVEEVVENNGEVSTIEEESISEESIEVDEAVEKEIIEEENNTIQDEIIDPVSEEAVEEEAEPVEEESEIVEEEIIELVKEPEETIEDGDTEDEEVEEVVNPEPESVIEEEDAEEIIEEPTIEEPVESVIEEEVVEEEDTPIPTTPEPIPIENNTEIISQIKVETENPTTIYRVRRSWEDIDTQIYASPDNLLAMTQADDHPGYKVYVGEYGELFYDPEENNKKNEVAVDNGSSNTKSVTIPTTGGKLVLKRCPVYNGPNAPKPCKYATGIYYYYDYTITNNRAKITENANIKRELKKNPSMIYGYIDIV